ncbi:hypothetical protein [Alcanivorax sp.]|uniref:hypothetical protein n=1 Tax=Alcanivorax sp. TaxID=1872427 RepID=UPI0025BDA1A2|nr:hypothetical protein [Alcanivorax sp.]
MKIVHLTVVRELPGGIKKQLLCEYQSARDTQSYVWETLAWHDYPAESPFVHQVPKCFRFIFLRQFFAWFLILKLSRQCDYILVRHMPFDIFSLFFSPFFRNRITVHHTKEVEEMVLVRPGWKGRMASLLENYAGRFALKRNFAIAGVTQEIVDYQCLRAGGLVPGFVYPNGIDTNSVALLDDYRSGGTFNLAFICTEFSSWHGLERLFDSVQVSMDADCAITIKVHLIGRLSEHQREIINGSDVLTSVFVEHGVLSENEYRAVMNICDAGIGSLALEEKGLREASTLKVREMLAMGLPVVSGHVDSSLPEDFPFYEVYPEGNVDLKKAARLFGGRKFDRQEVRMAAEPFITKANAMKGVVDFLVS